MTKQNIIDFLQWMNDTTEQNPMILETDNEDIAEAYLSSGVKIDNELPTTKPEIANWCIVNALRLPDNLRVSVTAKLMQHLTEEERVKAEWLI
jgi:hypothetical protein